jgi:Xaa-Pro aminopeptidase
MNLRMSTDIPLLFYTACMTAFRGLAALALLLVPAFGADRISLDEYRSRRAELRKANGDAITILFGASEKEHGDLRSGFFQEANFYYLTGWTEPGAIVVMTPSSEVLLIPRRNQEQERWTGPKLSPDDSGVRAATGFDTVLPAEQFETNLYKWAESGKRVFTLFEEPHAADLKKLLPLRDFSDAKLPIARLRMNKSPAEIALIQYATDISLDAHRAVWDKIRPGLKEFQVAAAMSDVYFSAGCERHSYAPIVGSGPNGAILHYSKNSRTIDRGELVLMDVAAECSMYGSDITRTVPASGKFTPRQRELYDIVLGAQKAVIDAIKPGMTLNRTSPNSLNKIAVDYFNTHGKDKHGNPLGKYYTHGVSHHVGLDVHDPVDPSLPLAPNMVITVEPGLYIPEEAIGIRIEDMVLITENGAKLMSSRLPREAGEIEKILSSHR